MKRESRKEKEGVEEGINKAGDEGGKYKVRHRRTD